MLGNDVVDLLVDNQKHLNKRYVNRVLTTVEQHYLSVASDQNNYLWSLWAAKEASYKACQKLNNQLKFSPIQFELDEACLNQLTTHDYHQDFLATLQHENTRLQLQLIWRFHPTQAGIVTAVHATALVSTNLEKLNEIDVVVTKMNRLSTYKNQSSQVRKLAQKILTSHGIKAKIERPLLEMNGYTKSGPPRLITEDEVVLPHEISLSHDNNWLAVTLLVQ